MCGIFSLLNTDTSDTVSLIVKEQFEKGKLGRATKAASSTITMVWKLATE
jgi:hypothetical protein